MLKYEKTLEVLKNQKNNIINILNGNKAFYTKNQDLIEKLYNIYNRINEYINKIKEEKYKLLNKNTSNTIVIIMLL